MIFWNRTQTVKNLRVRKENRKIGSEEEAFTPQRCKCFPADWGQITQSSEKVRERRKEFEGLGRLPAEAFPSCGAKMEAPNAHRPKRPKKSEVSGRDPAQHPRELRQQPLPGGEKGRPRMAAGEAIIIAPALLFTFRRCFLLLRSQGNCHKLLTS